MVVIKKIDHLVITTSQLEACLDFYQKLGFEVRDAISKYELIAGDFKINVHMKDRELYPHAENIQTGSSDFCFEVAGNLRDFKIALEEKGIDIELGVVERTGVGGSMESIYLRDPDGSLVEFCSYE